MKRSMLGSLSLIAGLAIAAAAAMPSALLAQGATLRGTVRSSSGEPVTGASVYITELAAQTATNEAGIYRLVIPGDRVRGQSLQLRVRAIGFRPSSRAVTLTAGEQSADFTLAADINRLEEIVVTGVMEGTEAARVPFAVSSVDMAEVPVPATDPLRLLAGRVPGATIISNTGRPGASASVILRGPTSINAQGRSQQPLYIIDGVILNGSLPDINPSDIENVEVVKGAAASSLYGARAGNGVIQITTRTGRRAADGLSFNTRVEYGKSDIEGRFLLSQQTTLLTEETGTRFCSVRTGARLCENTIDWQTEVDRVNNVAGDLAGNPAGFPLDLGATAAGAPLTNIYSAQSFPGRTYDAIDQAVNPQAYGQATVDATGRFGQTQVYASFGYLNQGGSIRFLEGNRRYSGRLNVDQRLADQWQLALRTYYAQSQADGLNEEGGTAFFNLTRSPAGSNLLGRDTLGRLYVRSNLQGGGSQNHNPLVDLEGIRDLATSDRFLGGLTLRFTPTSWLDFEGNGSYDLQNYTQDFFRDKGYRNTGRTPSLSTGSIRNYHSREYSYNTSFNATVRHRFSQNLVARWNARFLYERQDSRDRQASGTTLGAQGVEDLDNATAGQSITGSTSSQRQIGLFAGVNLDIFDGRYIVEGLIRRDGTSLFGADNRWATFGRFSLAWRPSAESWWFGGTAVNDLKLRFSRGSAGGRPRFSAQYQTFSIGTAGPSLATQGNAGLRPEVTVDNELGADFELFRRVGIQITRAFSETKDQILQVPLPADKGFGNQWQNAGALENKTWEVALNLPLISRRNLSWSVRATYDQTRTVVTALSVPPFNFGERGMFQVRVGERYGTIYVRQFVRSCAQLPAAYQTDCGVDGASTFQYNDEGYLVYVGAGHTPRDGITNNLYGTTRPGGTAATPWGVALNWGMPMILRDTACITTPNATCPAMAVPGGNSLPDWQFSVANNLQFGRFTVFGLMQGVMGREVYNYGRHWSHLDFITQATDQNGRSVEVAKPVGYYWRAPAADGFTGTGGFYDNLGGGPNSHFIEDASFIKLRELMVSYNVGPVGGVGNWTVSLVGRNLFTISNYQGFDPEVGQTGQLSNSGVVNAIDAFVFPNTRQLTFALQTSF